VVTFQLVVLNAPANSGPFVMVDTLPAELTYVSGSATGPAGFTVVVNGSEVRFENLTTNAAGTIVVTFKAQVTATAPCGTLVVNSATKEFAGTGEATLQIVGTCTSPPV
jgi:uncharacterized repeat protein (TIGR01451 family)